MTKALFRSPEEWKSALMTLPDSSCFDLLRSVFGNIKTPFNKQRLLEDLSAFLSRRDIQEALAAYIGAEDHRFIAAVAVLEEPGPGELERFFAGELSYAEVHSRIINLEERLILYRIKVEGLYRLALNPILSPVLAPLAEDLSPLFPCSPGEGGETEGAARGEGLLTAGPYLAALTAFVLERPDFFKAGGGIRKKVLEEGRLLFPGMEPELALGALVAAGLFQYEGEGIFPHEGRLEAFAGLSPVERREYIAAGMLLCLQGEEPGYFHRFHLQSALRFIHRFLSALEPGRRYPRITLTRIGSLLEREEAESPRPSAGTGPEREAALLSVLEKTGLLVLRGKELWSLGEEPLPGAAGGKPVIALDTAFSCILYPEIGLADALKLAYFSSVRETGTAVRLEIQRESAVRGFDRNISAGAMIELLERLSGERADPSLAWTLRDWESRYFGAVLYRGVVLTLSEDRRYLAEAPPVASLITQTLVPGVYLLSAADTAEAALALQKTGLDIVARRDRPANGSPSEDRPKSRQNPYPSPAALVPPAPEGLGGIVQNGLCPGRLGADQGGPDARDAAKGSLYGAGEAYKERFRKVLRDLQIPESSRDELAARIERGLILDESQLTGASFRYEKLEARGLDYVGKNAVAKQALASKSLVEVLWPGTGDAQNRALGIPQALEKRGGETVLVLKPMPQGEEFSLPLGRISLLRRIKQSIFEE